MATIRREGIRNSARKLFAVAGPIRVGALMKVIEGAAEGRALKAKQREAQPRPSSQNETRQLNRSAMKPLPEPPGQLLPSGLWQRWQSAFDRVAGPCALAISAYAAGMNNDSETPSRARQREQKLPLGEAPDRTVSVLQSNKAANNQLGLRLSVAQDSGDRRTQSVDPQEERACQAQGPCRCSRTRAARRETGVYTTCRSAWFNT